MNLYLVLLHLAGGVTLLLWAVRMVRTGVERSQEPMLRRILRESKAGRVRAAGVGAGIAVLLQSSTAVAVLAAGFAGSGALTVATGLALMLGADLGSSLVVQILSFDLRWLVPLLLIGGGLLFFKGPTRDLRQGGRILIGISLILISLTMISEATAPLREATFLPGIVGYLRSDILTAFLIGAAFTWLVHSSVASILLVATFAAQGIVPVELGISLMLGANLGGGLIAVGLTRQSFVEARRIALGNLIFRGLGALIALVSFHALDPAISWLGPDAARQVVNLHLLFNAALLILCLPLTGPVAKLVEKVVKPKPTPAELANPLAEAASALDQSVIGVPALALASATRELLRMAEIIERMLKPLMELYETGDPDKIKQAKKLEEAVDAAQSDIKLYLARIDYKGDDEARRGHELSNFAINLEHVGDAISKTLLKLAETRRDQKLQFSPEGWRELNELHHRVMANMQLALNVLVSKDRESARQLLEEKDAVGSAERESYGQHLRRLQTGAVESIETSNIHLETVRTLKTINSLFASVAYPILRDSGDLLDSRLAGKV
ncbi:MAG TPA: Na/Pi cotransporter family protein [Kofleriaceae bacterium]|nr:Na/Pi cotransporter family protein [Kofleriaceae bacterium]